MKKGRLITIGSFDGVHRGHQALLQRTIQEAKKRNVKSLALTFGIPPRMVLDKSHLLFILSEPKEKEFLIRAQGINEVRVLSFDQKMATVKPFAFFRDFLLRQLNAKGLVVGSDFRFGMGRSAGALELVRWGQEFQIPVWVISPVRHQRKVVSSSWIRHLLSSNRFQAAQGFLGHPYLIQGRVVKGRGWGRKLGFPTANLQVPVHKLLPLGVYVARAWEMSNSLSAKKKSWGVCNVGRRPTFTRGSKLTMEVHLFGKQKNLVGKNLYIELFRRLRREKKFRDTNQLKAAIASDVRKAKTLIARGLSLS